MISETVYATAVTIAFILAAIIFMALRVIRQQRIADSPLLISAWWETAVNLWNDELRQDRHMMQLIVAVAGVIVSISIGTIYGHNSWVTGWQLWTWFLTVLLMVIALMPRRRPFVKRPFTIPVTPLPGTTKKSAGCGSDKLRSDAAAKIAAASGCSEYRSKPAANCKR